MSDRSLLAQLDVGVPGALWRALLGAAFTWALVVGAPVEVPSWGVALLFLALLFSIKVFAGVARAILPATPETRLAWERRRKLARLYDSYQWRKLLWFGLGMLGVAASGRCAAWQLPLGTVCVVSGAIAHVVWRRRAPLLTVDGWLKVEPNGNTAKS